MGEYIKAYRLFVSKGTKRVLEAVYYICMVFIIANFIPAMLSRKSGYMVRIDLVIYFVAIAVFIMEASLDRFNIGIISKKSHHFEYFKISGKWKKVVWKGMVFEQIFRLIRIFAAFLWSIVCCCLYGGAKWNFERTAYLVIFYTFATGLVVNAIINLARRTDTAWKVWFAVSQLGGAGIVGIMVAMIFLDRLNIIWLKCVCIAIVTMLSILVSVISVRMVIKSVERTCYDEI